MLKRSGVDNIQVFPVTIVERDGDSIDKDYFTVNIAGCIKCADMDKSEYTDITVSIEL